VAREFGLGFALMAEECDWAMAKAEFVSKRRAPHDGSKCGDSLWNNYHGAKAEAALRRFVGCPLGPHDGREDPGWDVVVDGLRMDVKSYIHGIHERVQVWDNYWPVRADIVVVAHCARGRASRAVELRGWATRATLTSECVTWTPPTTRTEGRRWRPSRWLDSSFLRSIWDLPCTIATWPPEQARREMVRL